MRVMLLAPEFEGSCGVLDYSHRLAGALARLGVDIHIASGRSEGRLSLRALSAELRAGSPSVLHLQYPMAGFGASLMPQLATRLAPLPCVVTLHEFSQVHPLRRLASLAFSRADALIFTTPEERDAFCRWRPESRRRSMIVPLGSNIPCLAVDEADSADAGRRDLDSICYFGQLRPRRGLEAFLALARLAARRAPRLRFLVLGAVPAGRESYCQALRDSCGDLPNLAWELNHDQMEVAHLLAGQGFAYLPYPDGVSGRRGSLLAALGNGVLVITTPGPEIPPGLSAAVAFAGAPEAALTCIERLLGSSESRCLQRAAADAWVRDRGWQSIAERHLALYRQLSGTGDDH